MGSVVRRIKQLVKRLSCVEHPHQTDDLAVVMAERPFKPTLTGLPAELRNRIYELAVPKRNTYLLESPYPAICCTSKQLLHETAPIWRYNNTFVYYVPRGYHWFRRIRNDLHHIVHLHIILEPPQQGEGWKGAPKELGSSGFSFNISVPTTPSPNAKSSETAGTTSNCKACAA
ncbi:hypothetical protein LTR37_001618 [Vermiconidia calcicola]|uniref:Uncharacterized protein n=1 Tax=Vermiconidia calcicola TaxID=1690605 RepID=A0ACC3NWZ6_9PEZI|nr:hypothetical protein LTR37_001618 [Vermiconidia calcicola]